jgi:uncharacterized protein YycO
MNSIIKKNKSILLMLFVCNIFSISAQTSSNLTTNGNNKKIAQQHSVISNKVIEPQQNQFENVNADLNSTLDEDDMYQGRQKEILNNLTVKKIPNDFPKYQKGNGVIWYSQQIDNYYMSHPSIISELVRKKLGL